MESEVEHDQTSVHMEQIDFVATALLALKRGSSSSLCSSSSLASLNSNATSKDSAATYDMGVPTVVTKVAVSSTQEPPSPPLQATALQPSVATSTPQTSGVNVNDLPEHDLAHVSPRRLYKAKFVHPASSSCTQMKKNQQQKPEQRQQQIPMKGFRPTPSSFPTANFEYYDSNGIVQQRWSNMKNINKNMKMRHMPLANDYQPQLIIAVPPVLRPLPFPPPREIPFRNIAYSSVYDPNIPRRVSDVAAATPVAAGCGDTHSRVINLTTSHYDYHGESNENIDLANNIGLLSRQIYESGGGSSRNGGPLSQIYNEHRKLGGLYPSFRYNERTQHQQIAKQPVITAATSHCGSTPNAIHMKHRTAPNRLPKQITEYLKYWMSTHIDYPYPSEKEKKIMMNDTGIDRKRLDIWLRNNRNRNAKAQKSSFHRKPGR